MAAENSPRSALVHDLRGVALMRSERWSEALEAFDTAVSLDSTFDLAWFNRGLVHRKLGNVPEADRDTDKALTLGRDKAHMFFQRALARKRTGDLTGARADYDRALELAPDYLEAQYIVRSCASNWATMPGLLRMRKPH